MFAIAVCEQYNTNQLYPFVGDVAIADAIAHGERSFNIDLQFIIYTLRLQISFAIKQSYMKIETDTSFTQSQVNSPQPNNGNIMWPIQLRQGHWMKNEKVRPFIEAVALP